jgi:hypothetical protein
LLLPTKVKAALAGLAVAGGAAAAVLLGPAWLAVGQSSPPTQVQIQVNSPATLAAKGTTVDVSVTFSCSANLDQSGVIGVILTERSGHAIATGVGFLAITCTGTTQTVQVPVPADRGPDFKKGTAITNSSINACTSDFSSCPAQTVELTIDVD